MSRRILTWTAVLFIVLLINTAYVMALPSPTVFYMGNVLLHLALGVVLTVALFFLLREFPMAAGFFLAASALGCFLAVRGNTMPHRWALVAHVAAAALGLAAFIPFALRQAPRFRVAFQVSLAVLVMLPLAAAIYRKTFPDRDAQIRNGLTVPVSMDGEGGGPKSPFFPSSAQDQRRRHHPRRIFSWIRQRCGECHKDIYEQWKSSAHHFASFNNQFYRKAIEYMQDGRWDRSRANGARDATTTRSSSTAASTGPSRSRSTRRKRTPVWPARPATAIVHVDSTMGNGDFTIEYPPLHELASSHNPLHSCARQFPDLSQSGAAPRDVPEAVHARQSPSSARPATRCIWTFR